MAKITHATLEENKWYLDKTDQIYSDAYEPSSKLLIPLKLVENLPNLCFPDIHDPSPYSRGCLKAFNSKEAYWLFTSGWEKDPRIFHQEKKKLSVSKLAS